MSAISLEIPVVQRPTMLQVLMSSFITAVATLPFLAEPGFQDLRALLDGLENTICVATWQEDGVLTQKTWDILEEIMNVMDSHRI